MSRISTITVEPARPTTAAVGSHRSATGRRGAPIHPGWLRSAHWLNAIAVVLSVTRGWRIYNAAPVYAMRFSGDMTLGRWHGRPGPTIGCRHSQGDNMAFDFSGKRVLVAGGSRGIGKAIALQFAAAGADVALCARGTTALEAAQAEIALHGHTVHAMRCDLADAASIAAWVPAAAEALGGIDVLVNNASGFGMGDDEEGWATNLAVDVMAMVRSSRAALPWLQRSGAAGGSSIVHISSISAFRPSTRSAAYAAAKAAMNSYTGSQAATLCRQGIRVNAVAPGSIEFPGGVWEQRRSDNPALYERTLKSIPFGRMGTPDEIAEVVLFVASAHARWMTGQVLSVDGGQLLGA